MQVYGQIAICNCAPNYNIIADVHIYNLINLFCTKYAACIMLPFIVLL